MQVFDYNINLNNIISKILQITNYKSHSFTNVLIWSNHPDKTRKNITIKISRRNAMCS